MATTQPSTELTARPFTQQAVRGLAVLTQPLVLAGIAANAGAIAMAVMHGA